MVFHHIIQEIRELGSDAFDRETDWAIRLILLSLSALLSAIAVGTLLCILFKIWRRTIRGSQSLGILLLLGIITMHTSAFLFTTSSGNATTTSGDEEQSGAEALLVKEEGEGVETGRDLKLTIKISYLYHSVTYSDH